MAVSAGARSLHIPDFAKAQILCIGDLMLDRFIYGEVERISPEAPIPVLRITEERAMLGGVGNVARNLAALGAEVELLSVIGNDKEGAEIKGLLAASPRIRADVVSDGARRSTAKTRYVSMNQQMLRADSETVALLAPEMEAVLLARMKTLIAGADVLVLSDYGKGVLTPELCRAALDMARTRNIPAIVDPKGSNYEKYHGAYVVTPNRKELAEASGRRLADVQSVMEAARGLAHDAGIANILVTLSKDGMCLVGADANTHLPAEALEVFDVSGAGDTVVAALAASLAAGSTLEEAARLANTAAGIAVGKVGTAVVHAEELAARLRAQEIASAESKIASAERGQDMAAGWRARKLRVGFTNGCFDLLHPGHVALLAAARGHCDRLIVGLNSDASVRRLKGPKRPVQSELARATVLASLASVDLVILFEEDTPQRLIEKLKPDVLMKGGDYSIETVVGADFVQANGGQVVLIDLVPGFSTTGTIEKMHN